MHITVHLTPKASCTQIESFWRDENGDFHLKARVTTVPEKGKANSTLFKLLSDFFGVPKTRMTLVRGDTSRSKVIDIPLDADALKRFE